MSAEDQTIAFAVACPSCMRAVVMHVEAQWEAYDPESGTPERWTAAHCPNCKQATLYLQNYWSEAGWDEYWQAYPPQTRRLDPAVPAALRTDYSEAQRCVDAKCYTAGVIMARRVIEGICVEQGFKVRNLLGSLKEMRDAGVIDARLYDWADVVREVGNEGAHASGKTVSRDDTEEVLKFVEALLDYLYVFQSRYIQFKARRDAVAKSLASGKS